MVGTVYTVNWSTWINAECSNNDLTQADQFWLTLEASPDVFSTYELAEQYVRNVLIPDCRLDPDDSELAGWDHDLPDPWDPDDLSDPKHTYQEWFHKTCEDVYDPEYDQIAIRITAIVLDLHAKKEGIAA